MSVINLGRIKPKYLGGWNNSTTYKEMDIVSSDDRLYWCVRSNTNESVTNTYYWELLLSNDDKLVGTDFNTNLINNVHTGATIKTNAQDCYDIINNAPIGAHVEFIAQGDFDILTSKFNYIRSKHIFIKLRSGARIVFDQTLVLLGTHFRVQAWAGLHYFQADVSPMFKGYGCVGFFDYYNGQIRTDLTSLVIALESNGGDNYGSDGGLFVRYRNVSFKRKDGSNIDATNAPLSVIGKNLDGLRYGANFGGSPKTNALYLNGATYTTYV